MSKKYLNIQHYLIGRNVGLRIISGYSKEKKKWRVNYGKTSMMHSNKQLFNIIQSQNTNLYRRLLRLFPEYLV